MKVIVESLSYFVYPSPYPVCTSKTGCLWSTRKRKVAFTTSTSSLQPKAVGTIHIATPGTLPYYPNPGTKFLRCRPSSPAGFRAAPTHEASGAPHHWHPPAYPSAHGSHRPASPSTSTALWHCTHIPSQAGQKSNIGLPRQHYQIKLTASQLNSIGSTAKSWNLTRLLVTLK